MVDSAGGHGRAPAEGSRAVPGYPSHLLQHFPGEASWEFWVCNLISRSAFFVVLGKDHQELGLCPCYLLCKAGGALVGAQQAFLSLSRVRSWAIPLQGCSVHTHPPGYALTLTKPVSPACKSLLPRNTSGKEDVIPEWGTEDRRRESPVV